MALARILVPLMAGAERTSTFDLALQAGRILSARIDALCVSPDVLQMLKAAVGADVHLWTAELVAALEDAARKRRAASHAVFDAWMRRRGLTGQPQLNGDGWKPAAKWAEEAGDIAQLVGQVGRFNELIVLHDGPEADDSDRSTLEAALFEAQRPVLVASDVQTASEGSHPLDRCALVGWDGSREALHAVTAALPILSRAQRVVLLTIGASGPSDKAVEAALLDWLACHGVFPIRHFVAVPNGTIGQELLAQADHLGADLIVMGAYSHSRLRESVFGGTTRHVLANGDLPVLMAH